ncbi:hypothetical protein AY599_07810 [Leptolyngbya valderiana BDU 20041]|nr:hypothetical protein AY599_07810 [Leptolyngbya valderiana BDU 20041]
MNTDASGKCFVSYKRSRLREVRRLVESLHDVGIPTWQDITDLDKEPTELRLRELMADPTISCGVLWITPEVQDSTIIRQIEAPGLLERARAQDGFFVVPVCAGGIGYKDASIALDPKFSLEDLSNWNLIHLLAGPSGNTLQVSKATSRISSYVVRNRVRELQRQKDSEEPLVIRVACFAAPDRSTPCDLVLDWRHRWSGRHCPPQSWNQHLGVALRTVVDALLEHALNRQVVFEGNAALPAALLIGMSFLQPTGLRARWRQVQPDNESTQDWSLGESPTPIDLRTTPTSGQSTSDELAVVVSISGNASIAFANSRSELPPFKEIIHIHAPDYGRVSLSNGSQAHYAAQFVIDQIQAARDRLRYRGATHLFFAGPAGLAFLIGQLSNKYWPIQTYEYDQERAGGTYVPAAVLKRYEAPQPV